MGSSLVFIRVDILASGRLKKDFERSGIQLTPTSTFPGEEDVSASDGARYMLLAQVDVTGSEMVVEAQIAVRRHSFASGWRVQRSRRQL